MRKLFIPLVTVLFLSFTSCDKVKSLADVPINDIEISTDLNITPISGKKEDQVNFDASGKINPRENSDIDKYFSKIKEWKIKEVKITVRSVNYNGDGIPKMLKGAELHIGSAKFVLKNDFNIKNGSKLIINDRTFFNKAVNEISKGSPVVVRTKGSLSDYVKFTISVSTKFDIVANPL